MVHYLLILLHFFIAIKETQQCPSVCTCELASLSDLPINSVLVKSQHAKPAEQHLPSYQTRNEVLDETDELEAQHDIGHEKLQAATCVLNPTDNLPLFLTLSSDLEVLTILQGPGTMNITLDESYFQHLQKLIVLEIHGFQHGHGIIRLRNNALKQLQFLRYLNLQHIHLLGDRGLGNRPAPISLVQTMESNYFPGSLPLGPEGEIDNNIISEAIQFVPQQGETDIVPYSVYKDEQERAGLSTFANLNNLVFLRAFHCNIKEVNWEMFEGLQKLEYLSLEGNKIPFLHEFSFYGTPNLKHLTLSHNKLLDVQSTGLAGLLKLEILDLSFNNISHLTEFSLPPLPELIIADFHHNPLELILPYTFQIMNNTEQLYLGGKQAQLEVRHNSFLGLKKLKKLSLNNIYLDVLERGYLKGMPHLRELKVEGEIHELSFDAFLDVPKLHELILKHCSIRKISMDAFFGLYTLIHLDLSYNELETLPPSLFDHQKLLKEIYLNNNQLKTLPEGIFLNIPAKLISLDKNPWHCNCMMNDWLPSQINKIKVKIIDNSQCQSRYDKGSMCKVNYMYQYKYDQSVSPRCATPSRYSGWGVFHLLRKHLRCDKKLYKLQEKHKKTKIPLKENIHQLNNTSNDSSSTIKHHSISDPPLKDATLETDSRSSTTPLLKNKNEIKTEKTTEKINHTATSVVTERYDNQNLWTQKDKDKYKTLMTKEQRILEKLNTSSIIRKDKNMQQMPKINTDESSKTKKKSGTLKKWEIKMENTMRRLNRVPDDTYNIPT